MQRILKTADSNIKKEKKKTQRKKAVCSFHLEVCSEISCKRSQKELLKSLHKAQEFESSVKRYTGDLHEVNACPFFSHFLILSNLTWSLHSMSNRKSKKLSCQIIRLFGINGLSLARAKNYLPQPYHSSASPEQFRISAVSSEGTYRKGEVSSPQNGHLGWSVSAIWAPQTASVPTWLDAKQQILEELGNLMSSQKEKELPFWRVSQDI